MKVLIATPYFAPRVGGLELYAENIARELASFGWEVHVLTSGTSNSTSSQDGLTIHRLPIAATISNTPVGLNWTAGARRLIAQIQPDVINVHAPVPSMALAVAAAAGRTPLVVTYHAGTMKKGHLPADAAIAAYEQLALPWLMRRATAIICASDFVRTRFLGQWSHKSTTITPGVDTAKFTPAARHRIAGRVLFVGDFRDPRKGLGHLLDAIAYLPGATLRVVGQGNGQPQRGVTYTGVLTRAELVREMQSASLLVLPSTSEAESFGMVLIEAMACGLPVIGTDIGGIPGVITSGHDGLIVPPADAATLARAIQQLLINPDLAVSLGRNGRAKAESQYSWTARGLATDRLFRQAIGPSPTKAGRKTEVRHG